jgi:hypothetical protein
MAEFISIPEQNVAYNQAATLAARRPCNKGYVLHREGAGIITLRGIVNNPCAPAARYEVTYQANIAVPTGGTVGEISLAVAIQGEADGASLGASTPAAVEQFNSVSGSTQVDVPRGCCYTIALENTSDTAEPILVRNANVVVTRIG